MYCKFSSWSKTQAGNLDSCFPPGGTSKYLSSCCSPAAPAVCYKFFVMKTSHCIFQNVSFSPKRSKFVSGMEHEASDRDSSSQQLSHFFNDYMSVLSRILCNCTHDCIAAMAPKEKGQYNTMAKELKQALPRNIIRISWFHGWVAVVWRDPYHTATYVSQHWQQKTVG